MNKIYILIVSSLISSCMGKSEKLHMSTESDPDNCAKISDLLEDENYQQYEELVNCEMRNAHECKSNEDSYACKRKLNSLFFNPDFNAIDYGYSQSKLKLLEFIAKNMNKVSNQDADFINHFVFSQIPNSCSSSNTDGCK